jgi:hypothetical protein
VGGTTSKTYHIYFYYRVKGTSNWSDAAATPTTTTSDVNVTGSITGLTAGETYEYETVLVDQSVNPEDKYSGSIVEFTTLSPSLPVVITGIVTSLTSSSVTLETNEISTNGGAALTSYGLAYGTATNPTAEKQVGNTDFTSYPAVYDATINSGTPSTHYYIRAYATNAQGTAYGTEGSGWTEPNQVTDFDSIGGLDPNNQTKLTVYFGHSSHGNGTGVVVKIQEFGNSTEVPTDGVVYTANTVWPGTPPSGGQVVYAGNNVGSVEITGLDGTKDYRFTIIEYAGSSAASGTDLGINYYNDNVKTITTSNTEFPIELLSFTAKNERDNVVINWATASEIDNDYFEIERSTDAENFVTIANVRGAGYSNSIINYSIEDNDALEGTVYYRLKQTDFNGDFTYSYILPVQIGASNELQISNVINADNSISFIYNNNKGGITQVKLLDMNGRVINTQEVSGEGSQRVRMNMHGISHGIYILHLTLNDQTIVKKVVY